MLIASCASKKSLGQPFKMVWNMLVGSIKLLIPDIDSRDSTCD